VTARADRPLQLGRHVIVAVAIGLVAPFTAFAWPFAIATGIVIARGEVERINGVSASAAQHVARFVEVIVGALAMLFAGVFFGGLIAFVIVALTAFSERMSAEASPTDRTLARIVLFIGGGVGWVVLGIALGLHVNFRIGA
jgi:hypothetical protein